MKRLTNDDRERMMRSRALPANFDMSRALHSPFAVSRSTFDTPIPPSAHHTPIRDPSVLKPPTVDISQQIPIYDPHPTPHTSLNLATPLGGFATTPHNSTPDTMPSSRLPSQRYETEDISSNLVRYGPSTHQLSQGHTSFGTPDLYAGDRFTKSREVIWTPRRANTYSGVSSSNLHQDPSRASKQLFSEYTFFQPQPPQQQRSEANPKSEVDNTSSSCK